MYLVEARELMVSACARLQIEQPVRARALDQTQDHFRINFSHFLNASLDAHPCIWKWDFIHMEIKVIFIWMVIHQASL